MIKYPWVMEMKTEQIEMVSIEMLMPEKHAYRKLKALLKFPSILRAAKMPPKDTEVGADGFGEERLILCLILQFMEDRSDREYERFIAENHAAKWFCGFGLTEKTPDYSTICKFRNKLGTSRIGKIFHEVNRQLKNKGFLRENFTFVDATALVSKLQVWEERDKAIADGYEELNNKIIAEYSADKEVRIGAKSAKKFWVGFKKHISVDTQSGMINKVAVTLANLPDADGAKFVLPNNGAVLTDKGYVPAIRDIRRRGLHEMVIRKNNMKDKIPEKDAWISKLRSPYERVFSKQQKRARYRGTVKNQAAEMLYAVAFNFRRLLVIAG